MLISPVLMVIYMAFIFLAAGGSARSSLPSSSSCFAYVENVFVYKHIFVYMYVHIYIYTYIYTYVCNMYKRVCVYKPSQMHT
jgi:hypothetical protein